MAKGQILQSLSGYYDVIANGLLYRTRARGNFRQKKITPLVGDWVEFKADNQQEGYLLKIDPRKNHLVRPPIANIDCAIVVVSCKEPNFSANLLDRQLVMLAAQKITPLIYFSKLDLLTPIQRAEFKSIVAVYQKWYQTFTTISEIKDLLMNKLSQQTLVVMGQTGAGKSTLLNHLAPELNLATGAVSKALSRGKHTTRKVALFQIGQNYLADTPGFSSFELQNIIAVELRDYFPELAASQTACKFRGCLHQKEPHCAVKAAVQAGSIAASRYQSYLQLLTAIQQQKPRY
jgi:ribosome biogenesis GTPase